MFRCDRDARLSWRVRAADASKHTTKQATDNVMAVAGSLAPLVGGWANVQGVFLKVADSVALPVYQAEGGAKAPVEEPEEEVGAKAKEPKKSEAQEAALKRKRARDAAPPPAQTKRKQAKARLA